MTDVPDTTSAGPVPESQRLGMLDLLRGFALLGIFMVNMQFFTMVFSAFMKPDVFGDAPWTDVLAWGFVKTFFEYKFISLFSVLFGAGMVVQMTRAKAKGRPFVPTYLRRMVVLALIGLIHGFLLWYGDILFIYSIVGTALLVARNWRPRTMFITAGSIIAFFFIAQLTIGLILYARIGGFHADTDADSRAETVAAADQDEPPFDPLADAADPDPEPSSSDPADPDDPTNAEEEPESPPWSEENPELAQRFPWLAAMRDSGFNVLSEGWVTAETAAYKEGPYSSALAFRSLTYVILVLFSAVSYGWRVLATFLIGAALMKLGFFAVSAGRWHRRLFFIGMGFGIPAELAHTVLIYAGAGKRVDLAMLGATLHEPGSLAVCLGLVGAAGMIISSGTLPKLVRAISAVGRLALSNYLLQTVMATFLMYSWGLGYFGEVPRPWQVALVLVIYALQIPLSVLWLRFFTIGPMEWIWRSLTYNKRQPMRRRSTSDESPRTPHRD